MKKLLLIGMLGIGSLAFNPAKAQVSVNVNIGAQPQWGPAGYNRVDYYYLPDVESYYYVPTRQFIYLNAGRWVFAASLPSRYRGYDLYSGYKVVCNRPDAYRYYDRDRVEYARYRNWRGERQVIIRDKYKGHPHGMPPGQAKKYYSNNGYYHQDRYNDDRGRRDYNRWDGDNGKGHGKGHGKGKHGKDRD